MTDYVSEINPNAGSGKEHDTFTVCTDDERTMYFEILRKGPYQKTSLISLVSAEPPIALHTLQPKEVYVSGDVITEGEEFELQSMFPILTMDRPILRALCILATFSEQ